MEAAISAFGLVLEIRNIVAHSSPADARHLHIFAGVHGDLHAFVVDRVWLHEIDNIELVLLKPLSVVHAEVEPLGDVASVVVRLQNQVVLIFAPRVLTPRLRLHSAS